MKRVAVLAIVAAICFALVAADYNTAKVADKDFLTKQKKIYNLLYYISQPSLVNPSLYEEGQSYNIEANIDSYTNTAAVKDFLYLYKYGMLPRGELYSPYYPKLRKETEALFRLFYYAKDFEIFYKTALWARIYINEMQFGEALYTAVIRREDTKFIQLPPPYEMYPYAFFNAEVLEKAHHAKLFGKLDSKKFGAYDVYIIPANYSGCYMSHEHDVEHTLTYFTEDIGLNAYYFYFRKEYPFSLKGEEFGLQNYRGEEYLYAHKQLLMRYNLERLSNDAGKVEDFDFRHKEFYPGYYPMMTYHNGLPLPQRGFFSKFPYYKYKYIKEVNEVEARVSAAIDSGYIIDKSGKFINIYAPEGINILGNIIEGNADSCNPDFYGSIDVLARKILGFNLEPSTPYQIIPSALELYSTSMRDPAFYRIYQRIFDFYYNKYKMHQKPYNKNEIVYPELKIESFTVDKLITYFDQFDTSISNGLVIDDAKEAESMLIKVRQYRLNHKPFSFHLSINADKAMKSVIRIFLGPKYDAHHKPLDFVENAKYFYEMDNFIVDLNAGVNKIVRNSQDCFFVIPDPEPSEVFYKKVMKSLDGSDSLSYMERLYGFPERLLLPKGKKEGMPFQIFAYVNPLEGEPVPYMSRIFGGYKFDKKPFGFPLDRPVLNFRYDGPNMQLKDVLIYHKDEMELNVTY
ncbi:arylphorin subunit alpha [Harpegnathos saltator]|uniref:Arylphorin subunit alpha n=1 Tax=Harpegnathos saltator TaxID=610380 RepID=E2BPJ9_HARSA|nr:arylphorin subunit alpha [Harpegnathos saltator]EFN82403.1 Arylphorin subunit alpha [Harpegnathos saltator]